MHSQIQDIHGLGYTQVNNTAEMVHGAKHKHGQTLSGNMCSLLPPETLFSRT